MGTAAAPTSSRKSNRPQPDTPAPQTPEAIADAIRQHLAAHPASVLLEDGAVLFDLATARCTLESRAAACVLHLWSDERNLVRRIVAANPRGPVLRLTAMRFGQARTHSLELAPARGVRSIGTREARRRRFVAEITRLLERAFPDDRPSGLRSATDLERSFGPAFCRGSLVHGREAWAIVAVDAEESQTTIDGILSIGLLWLEHLREQHAGRRLYRGLRLLLPDGTAATTLSRLRWLRRDATLFELYTLNRRTQELTLCDPDDGGNQQTRLQHAPDLDATHDRLGPAIAKVVALLPPGCILQSEPRAHPPRSLTGRDLPVASAPLALTAAHRANEPRPHRPEPRCEIRLRSSAEIAFLCHGLEFARVRSGFVPGTFRRSLEITVGHGTAETPLTDANADALRTLIAELFDRRQPAGDPADELFRTQPERWLESTLLHDLPSLDPAFAPAPVYAQVPAFTGAGASLDRGMLDLLTVTTRQRLAVIEVKANEDLHLAMQGLDYWIRVREHHLSRVDPATGLGSLQAHGYFPATRLQAEPPHLYLVAPALRIHPATETILRYLDPAVEWTLIALDERWRTQLRPVWRRTGGASRL